MGHGGGSLLSGAGKISQFAGAESGLADSGAGTEVYPEKLGEAKEKRKDGTFLRALSEGTGGRSGRYSIIRIINEIEKQGSVGTG